MVPWQRIQVGRESSEEVVEEVLVDREADLRRQFHEVTGVLRSHNGVVDGFGRVVGRFCCGTTSRHVCYGGCCSSEQFWMINLLTRHIRGGETPCDANREP
jgi:hypothetical protein